MPMEGTARSREASSRSILDFAIRMQPGEGGNPAGGNGIVANGEVFSKMGLCVY
jgi:hypothetical protein